MKVEEHLRSIFYVGHFFGLAPYKFNLNLSKQLLWYSLLLILIFIAYWPIEYYLTFDTDSFSIAHLADVALLSVTYFIAVYKSVSNINLLKQLFQFLKKVDSISSLKCDLKKSNLFQYSLLFVISFSLFDAITADEKLKFWEYVPLIFIMSFEDQFRQMVLLFSTRLDTLSSLIGKTDPVRLIMSYHFLYEASKIFNKMYSLQVFAYIISVFAFSITEAYLLAKAYLNFSNAKVDSQIDIIIYSLNFALRFFQVFLMCHVESSLVNKCRTFHRKMVRAMENDISEAMFENDKLQLHVIMNCKMTFTCFGYFDLDYSLLQMIASTTAIYVLIIIQFDISCSCTILN